MSNMHVDKARYALDAIYGFNWQEARDTLFGILECYGTDVMPVGPALQARYGAADVHPDVHSVFVTEILAAYLMLDRFLESDKAHEHRSLLIAARLMHDDEMTEVTLAQTPLVEVIQCIAFAADVLAESEVPN